MKVALIGNQNCGKTTLFNRFTGASAHVGNFPGVTVERREGALRTDNSVTVVDLPGIYSLFPYSDDERIALDYILNEKPDLIVNIADATNLSRNLYLTLQVLELGIPTVLVLNMMDECAAAGTVIDLAGIAARLGCLVFAISAAKNTGVDVLVAQLRKLAKRSMLAVRKQNHKHSHVALAQEQVAKSVALRAKLAGVPAAYAASQLLLDDAEMAQRLSLNSDELAQVEQYKKQLQAGAKLEPAVALISARYDFIDHLVGETVKQGTKKTREQRRTLVIDKLLLNKHLAIPIFLVIMILIFWVTFGPPGSYLSGLMTDLIDALSRLIMAGVARAGAADWLVSLVGEGILGGVGSVLSFMPTILVLFLLLSVLEDTGYMARVAFIMDRALGKIGLSGRCLVPLLLGYGCSVPAIMATRTLPGERDKKMTVLLVPFMPCSAKLTIFTVFAGVFAPNRRALFVVALYAFSMLVGILYALFFKNTIFKKEPLPFVLELPPYRFPSFLSVMRHMWQKAKDFLKKAFTVIFLASIVIWLLQSFDGGFRYVTDNSQSILAAVGGAVAPVFAPLGFGDWRAATAVLNGLIAKEAVVSTLGVLTNSTNGIAAGLFSLFSPLSAASFCVFTLLYMPCVAAFAAIRREFNSWLNATLAVVCQTGIAWLAAFAVFQIGSLLGL